MKVAVKLDGKVEGSITWTLLRLTRKGSWSGTYWLGNTPIEPLGEVLFSQSFDSAKLIPPKINIGGGTTRFLVEINFTGTITAYEVG